jgi:hypothetical protein
MLLNGAVNGNAGRPILPCGGGDHVDQTHRFEGTLNQQARPLLDDRRAVWEWEFFFIHISYLTNQE